MYLFKFFNFYPKTIHPVVALMLTRLHRLQVLYFSPKIIHSLPTLLNDTKIHVSIALKKKQFQIERKTTTLYLSQWKSNFRLNESSLSFLSYVVISLDFGPFFFLLSFPCRVFFLYLFIYLFLSFENKI